IKHSIRSELRERAFNEPIAPGQWLRCAPPWIKQIARREKNQRFQIVAARLERLNDHAEIFRTRYVVLKYYQMLQCRLLDKLSQQESVTQSAANFAFHHWAAKYLDRHVSVQQIFQ